MTAAELLWSATETESVEPFRVSWTALDGCKLRLGPDENFEMSDVRIVEGEDFWKDFAPELLIELDIEDLKNSTGLDPDDATVSIVVRDRELNKFLKVEEWFGWDIPDNPVDLSHSLGSFSHSERLDICVLVSPATTKVQGEGVAKNRGEIVGKKVFRIRPMTQTSNVPHRWVKPEEFEACGLAEDTIWLVHWRGEDLDRPPAEVVEIWLNEALKVKFQLLVVGGDAAQLFRHEMVASIFSEMALAVLNSDQIEEEPFEPNGTLKIISDELSKASGLKLVDIRQKMDGHGGTSLVRAWAQSHFQVNKQFSDLEFVGGGT